jgi:hypothetical protein
MQHRHATSIDNAEVLAVSIQSSTRLKPGTGADIGRHGGPKTGHLLGEQWSRRGTPETPLSLFWATTTAHSFLSPHREFFGSTLNYACKIACFGSVIPVRETVRVPLKSAFNKGRIQVPQKNMLTLGRKKKPKALQLAARRHIERGLGARDKGESAWGFAACKLALVYPHRTLVL